MNPKELTLPEFAFIEGSEHEENQLLKGRTVFQHIKSYTVFELFDKEDAFILKDQIQKFEFEHINIFGAIEELVLAVHITLADAEDMPLIFDKAATWYRDYCNWEDRNIEAEGGL